MNLIRVLRVVEFVGQPEAVATALSHSVVQGTRFMYMNVQITAANFEEPTPEIDERLRWARTQLGVRRENNIGVPRLALVMPEALPMDVERDARRARNLLRRIEDDRRALAAMPPEVLVRLDELLSGVSAP